MTDIGKRKQDHIELALKSEHQSKADSSFDTVRFEHNALPEISLSDISLGCKFLNQDLAAPLMIGAMTGGCENGDIINRHLGEAAEACNIPMAVGSQRAALENNQPQTIRQYAPNAVLLGNIGATQIQQQGIDLAERAVEAIEANALIIHLNPLQELVQQGGDRNWKQVLEAIYLCADKLSVPVIVKEVGAGISPSNAKQLEQAGIKWIEVAGRGGTNWASIEYARNQSNFEQQVALPFLNWGMDTAKLLPAISANCPSLNLIGSGGVRDGLDIARCIRLGACVTALAQPFLAPALESTEAVVNKIAILKEQLRWAMFLTGSKDLEALKKAKLEE
ncbi:type 2 isopentenyl-diphosphate Delta-isomerase [Porticoccaceae bacterium]|nr:type 2 isopentenyl-diphosphate Delta-isomerase [Porticoccaceae bacterium]